MRELADGACEGAASVSLGPGSAAPAAPCLLWLGAAYLSTELNKGSPPPPNGTRLPCAKVRDEQDKVSAH